VAASFVLQGQEETSPPPAGSLTDVPGIKVGHHTYTSRPTGCTVVLTENGAVASVDVRGSAPGTRETDLLDPLKTVQTVHAILLSGGSAFGLDAAAGVVQYLEEKGVGFPTSSVRVPIVPAAILFDLGLGDPKIRPDREAGYKACQNASPGPVEEGNVGAGTGATVGKMFGMARAMKGGLGSCSIKAGRLVVAALTAVNCIGNVFDVDTGKVIAGTLEEDGESPMDIRRHLSTGTIAALGRPGENTTLSVVATNAALDKVQMKKIAEMGHDGLARAINPVHLPFDGDTVFALSTGGVDGVELGQVGSLAAQAVSQSIVRAVLSARRLAGVPSARDLRQGT
jgi:L-aminopeptidase/D-esterase-like protein